MHARTLRRVGIAAAGLAASVMTLSGPAFSAGAGTIHVPSDFVKALSDTRATGHYEVVGTGLRVWTEGSTSTDKVAEYVATSTPLAATGEPALEYTPTTGTIPPGFQQVVDFDGNGTGRRDPGRRDALRQRLVGQQRLRTVRQGRRLPPTSPAPAAPTTAPSTSGAQRSRTPTSMAFGFSLGSGVYGDGVINALDFAGTRYTFVKDVKLTSKDQCKNGGWATSTQPVFKNQGDCVSSFASAK